MARASRHLSTLLNARNPTHPANGRRAEPHNNGICPFPFGRIASLIKRCRSSRSNMGSRLGNRPRALQTSRKTNFDDRLLRTARAALIQIERDPVVPRTVDWIGVGLNIQIYRIDRSHDAIEAPVPAEFPSFTMRFRSPSRHIDRAMAARPQCCARIFRDRADPKTLPDR